MKNTVAIPYEIIYSGVSAQALKVYANIVRRYNLKIWNQIKAKTPLEPYKCLWESQASFARQLDMNERVVRRYIKELVEAGWLHTSKAKKGNNSNFYIPLDANGCAHITHKVNGAYPTVPVSKTEKPANKQESANKEFAQEEPDQEYQQDSLNEPELAWEDEDDVFGDF